MTRGLKAVADLLLPRVCVVCGRKLLLNEKNLCLYCAADLPMTRFWTMTHNPMSERFNAVIQKGMETKTDAPGTDDPEGTSHEKYVYAAALFFYDSDAGYKNISHQLKYHGNTAVGSHFGKMLGRKLAKVPWFSDVDTVIPVPLHWIRKWKRGYNQAEIIASEISKAIGASLRTDMLKRVRNTKTQTQMDIQSKAANVDGAFICNHIEHSDIRHILIVDDVFTTGATLHACFVALRQLFPTNVRISIATLCFVGT